MKTAGLKLAHARPGLPWSGLVLRERLARLSVPLIMLFAAVALGVSIANPTGPRPLVGMTAMAGLFLLALAGVVAVAYLPANAFCIGSVGVFATLQLSAERPIVGGGVLLYSTDILLVLVLARAAMPRDRLNVRAAGFALPTRVLIGVWLAIASLAVAKALVGGTEADTALRLFSPVVYWVGFYVGFSRVFRESTFRVERFVRDLIALSLLLVAYMFAMRVLNRPFETGETGGLGRVVTSEGDVLRRDFGFWSAYIFFPLLALIGVARLAYSSTDHLRWAFVAGVGVVATLTTLIRGEIYGLALGFIVLLLALRSDKPRERSQHRRRGRSHHRMRVIILTAGVMLFAGLLLSVVTPTLAGGVVERALPGLRPQGETADENAQYRYDSLVESADAVGDRLLGFGFVGVETLRVHEIDIGYLEHSAPARVLVYTGWLGLVAAVAVLLALAIESWRSRSEPVWLHALFVGALAMLVAYSMSAAGIAGQAHVVGLAALLVALRFARAPAEP